ncbi:MAG TPA: hypothetical protein VF227_07285, partial [Actinomycetes bacterium]
AERIRSESERELAAATQRRDSINSQLTNVRQMLATLTGASLPDPLADEQPAQPAAKDKNAPAEDKPEQEQHVEAPADAPTSNVVATDVATDADEKAANPKQPETPEAVSPEKTAQTKR